MYFGQFKLCILTNLTRVEEVPNLTKVEEVPCLSCFLELFLETFLSRFNLQAHTDAAAGEQGAASGLGGTSECSRVDHEQISTACYKVRKSTLNDQKLILEDKVVFSRLVNAPNPDFTNINQLKIQVYWTFF